MILLWNKKMKEEGRDEGRDDKLVKKEEQGRRHVWLGEAIRSWWKRVQRWGKGWWCCKGRPSLVLCSVRNSADGLQEWKKCNLCAGWRSRGVHLVYWFKVRRYHQEDGWMVPRHSPFRISRHNHGGDMTQNGASQFVFLKGRREGGGDEEEIKKY